MTRPGRQRACTAISPRRCSMARRRASMREGPLAELFRATEAAQRQAEGEPEQPPAGAEAGAAPANEPDERTVDHVPSWEESARREAPAPPAPPPVTPEPVPPPAPPQIRAVPSPPVSQPVVHYAHPDPLPEQPARLHRAPPRDAGAYLAVIKDIQALHMSDAPVKIHIGRELTKGLGSGADPDIGRLAADEGYDQLKHAMRGADMVFVAAGEGGGTGTGAAPIVAKIARELG